MLRSFFTSKLPTPIMIGEELKQVKINFLLPVVFLTFFYALFSLTVSIISKEYGLMIAFIGCLVLLLLSFDFLRNGSLNAAVMIFLIQGFGFITALFLFGGIDLIARILMVVFYLIVTGLITSPKVFILLSIYCAVLIYLMVSDIVVPFFPFQHIPQWYSFIASLAWMIIFVIYAIFLAYRAMMQSLQIAVNANKLRDQAEQNQNKYFSLIKLNPLSIFTTDLDGKIEYVNTKFCELLGYEPDEVIGKTPRILKTEHTPPDFHEDLWKKITEGRTWIGEFINRRKDESVFYQSAVIAPLFDSSGEKTGYVAYEDDISLQKEIAQEMRTMNQELKDQENEISQLINQLKEQSIHDPVTNLYNRRYLLEMLPREILRATRAKNNLILMLIDLDKFQSINHEYGVTTGDLVLKNVAESISSSLSPYDLAFRYGSDEFLVLFSEKSIELGESRAEQLREIIEKISIPGDQGEIHCTVSIGVAVFPLHGKKEIELLNRVEDALTISKRLGGNRVTLWSDSKD